jgi:NAD(P)-dependent dehydrogenase (short-subunit alcohol dehydrogenase family)
MSGAGSNRVALVTGAGRGIGRSVARRLSMEGLRVAVTARSSAQLAASAGECPGATLVLPADITDPVALDQVCASVEAEWGAIDVVVANAGAASSAPLASVTDQDWQQMLDLNLTAPFRCLRRTVPGMVARGYGRVVVIASVAAKRGEPYLAAYTASKHGVLGLVRSVAAEVGAFGVTVNAVCPGYVDTPMTESSVRTISERTSRSIDEVRAILAAKQPNGRLVTVEEVADAVWLCVTNAAMNGQGITVDGGGVQS